MNGQRLRYAVPAAVTGLAWVLVLAGCTTGSPAPPTGSTTGVVATTNASPSTSSGSPSASPSGSTARLPYPTDVPADALANTPKGAEAFVRYFFARLNRAYMVPDSGLLTSIATPNCLSCVTYDRTAAEYVAKGYRYDRPAADVLEVSLASDPAPPGGHVFDVVVHQQPAQVRDASGAIVDTIKDLRTVLAVQVVFDGQHWRIDKVRGRS